ncbi:HlyD family efflux transporter periplasmic adaptor subunit, partial [bacterium]
ITSRLATLSSRTDIIKSMLPLAESGMKQANEFMGNLNRANAQGLTVNKSLYEVSAAAFTASERMITLKSESASLNSELETNRSVLKEITTASNNLQKVYNGGVLTAPVSGIVGSTIAAPGEVMGSSSSKVASIYTGTSFVLAYMPESYLFDVEAGQPVVVKSRGSNVVGHIEAVLPVSDALPPEFQAPSKARDRGQVVKITLEDTSRLAVEQKIRVTSCYVTGCKTSYTEQAWQRAPVLYKEAKAYIETNAPIYYGRARSYVASLDIPTKVSKGYQTAAVTTKKWIDSLSGSPAEASPDQPRIANR